MPNKEPSYKSNAENAEFIPPMGTSGARLKSYQGGVEVPSEDRKWALRLGKDFSKPDYITQVAIIDILGKIQKLNPEEAKNAGKILEEYFRGVSKARDPQSLTETLTETLEREKNKKVQ
jgi:hypothetical protein